MIEVPRGITILEAEKAPNQSDRVHRFFVIEDDSELNGKEIKNPEQAFDPNTNEPLVNMEFTDKGREAFARVTKRIADRGRNCETLSGVDPNCPQGSRPDDFFQRFAISLDNRIVSLATIDYQENPEGIDGRNGASIQNIGSIQDAQDLAENLRIGALPIDLKLISQTQVSATLGKQALHQGLTAAAAGLAATILFLLIFYRVLGVVATVALLIYALLLFALIKLIPITLTLPGIAGMVLTLAVAADANIVMFERIKEEVRSGRSVPAAISAGYTKALRTIIDANVVTIGVAFILFTLATAGVRGFAFTLGVGTLVSLFTAVLATSAILGSLARTRILRRPSALGVATKETKGWKFDFMGNARWFFSLSGAILAVGAIAISTLGINFGIDFESGTRITAPLQRAASVDQVRNTLSPLGYGDAEIQEVKDPELGQHVVQIQVSQLEPAQVTKVQNALNDDYGVATKDFVSNSVGPTFGAQIARTAVIAVVASLLLIAVYIGFRFEWKFAVPVHDRPRARPSDHRRRVRPLRQGGHDRHGRRPADDLGLLVVRHGDRVRPNTRERAAHAAGDLLADSEPVDVRGLHAIAGHELRRDDAGRLAAAVRRRDAEGLCLRAARGRALGRLLVDLHRDAGAGRVEGARADLHAPPAADAAAVRRSHPGLRDRHARRARPAAAAAGAGAGAGVAAAAATAEPEAPSPTTRAGRRQRREAATRSRTTTQTATRPQRPRTAPPPPGDGAPRGGDGAPPPGDGAPRDGAPPSQPSERSGQPSAETPASPSAPAAPSEPPANPRQKQKPKRQKRRKHGRR